MLFESTCPAEITGEEQQIAQQIVLAARIAHDQAFGGNLSEAERKEARDGM